jgi:hypothetical protein
MSTDDANVGWPAGNPKKLAGFRLPAVGANRPFGKVIRTALFGALFDARTQAAPMRPSQIRMRKTIPPPPMTWPICATDCSS